MWDGLSCSRGEPCAANGVTLVKATPYAADGTTQNGPWVKTYYDVLGRELATDTQGFDGAVIRQNTQYDDKGRVWRTSRPYFLSGGTPRWTYFTYDALGRVTRKTDPNGAQSDFAYHGLSSTVTSDLGQTKTTVLNARGEIEAIADAHGKTTRYGYDPFGNLKTTTDPAGNVIANSYDVRGRKTASDDPDMGQWSYAYDVLDRRMALRQGSAFQKV